MLSSHFDYEDRFLGMVQKNLRMLDKVNSRFKVEYRNLGGRNEFSATLPFPLSVNTYYRMVNKRMLISEEGRKYKTVVASLIRGMQPMEGDLYIETFLYPPSHHKRDLDNFDSKALWDALTHAKVWKDDSQVKKRYSEWRDVTEGGKVEVKITKIIGK